MKHKISLIIILLLAGVSSAFSQVRYISEYGDNHSPFQPEYYAIGMRGGMGMSWLNGLNGSSIPGLNSAVKPYDSSPDYSISGTLDFQLMFYNQLMLQTDLYFKTIETKLKHENYTTTVKAMSYGTRLFVGSKSRLSRDTSINFVYGVGSFFELNEAGDGNVTYDTSSDYELEFKDLDLKKFNMGWSAMAGFELENCRLIVGYDHSLLNIARTGVLKPASFYVELGFIFAF